MTLNPIKVCRAWRERRDERRDIQIRHQSLIYALKTYPVRRPEQAFIVAAQYYNFIKHGISPDGSTVEELVSRTDIDWRTPMPDSPIKP